MPIQLPMPGLPRPRRPLSDDEAWALWAAQRAADAREAAARARGEPWIAVLDAERRELDAARRARDDRDWRLRQTLPRPPRERRREGVQPPPMLPPPREAGCERCGEPTGEGLLPLAECEAREREGAFCARCAPPAPTP